MLSSLLDAVDGEAQLLLRKLGKRDTVTKLKGLAELRDALAAHDADWAAALLPQWVACFCKLSADSSWQVREASCAVMGQMAGLVGRQLAPQLKPLMAAWLCARHDPHGATASAAAAALGAAFPSPKKLSDALLFCRDDLVRGLAERALTPPPPPSKDKDEEAESLDAHARRVGAALRAASQLLSLVGGDGGAAPTGPRAELGALLGESLCAGEVWKLSASKSAYVRLGAYDWAATLLRHPSAGLATAHAADLATLLLGGLAESEAACQAALWEPLLMLLSGHAEALSGCAAARHTLPRLTSLLRHGCHGAAPTVCRALLPLASLLPPEHFAAPQSPAGAALPPAASLLGALWEGLGSPGLPSSHASAMLRAYAELLQLLVVRVSSSAGASAGARCAALLRSALGHPTQALLDGRLPPKLSDADATSGLADAAVRLASSARCADAIAPFWAELATQCAEACAGEGSAGKTQVALVAATLLLTVRASLGRRSDDARATAQLRNLTAAVGRACVGSLYPAARHGAAAPSALLLELINGYGLCALWHAASGAASGDEPGAAPASGAWMLDLVPAACGTRVRVVASRLSAAAPPHLRIASSLVADQLLPWAAEVAAAGATAPGSAAVAARGAAAFWARLLAEEAAAVSPAAEADAMVAPVRMHWRQLLSAAAPASPGAPAWGWLASLLHSLRSSGGDGGALAAHLRCEELDALAARAAAAALGTVPDASAPGSASAATAAERFLVECSAGSGGLLGGGAAAAVLEACGAALTKLADAPNEPLVSSQRAEAWAARVRAALRVSAPLLAAEADWAAASSASAEEGARRAAAAAGCLRSIFGILELKWLRGWLPTGSAAATAAAAGASADPGAASHRGWASLLRLEVASPEEEPVLAALELSPLLAEATAAAEVEAEEAGAAPDEAAIAAHAECAAAAAAAAALWDQSARPLLSSPLLSGHPSVHSGLLAALWRAAAVAAPKSLAQRSGWREAARRWAWMVRRLLDLGPAPALAGATLAPLGATAEATAEERLDSALGQAAWAAAAAAGGAERLWLVSTLAIELLLSPADTPGGTGPALGGAASLLRRIPLISLNLLGLFFSDCVGRVSGAAAVARLEGAGWSAGAVAELRAFVVCELLPFLRSGGVGGGGGEAPRLLLAALVEAAAARAFSSKDLAADDTALLLLLRCARGPIPAAAADSVAEHDDSASAAALLAPGGALSFAFPKDAAALEAGGLGTRLCALRLCVAAACPPPAALTPPAAAAAPSQLSQLTDGAVRALLALRPGAAAAARAAEARLGGSGGADETARAVVRLRVLTALLPSADQSLLPLSSLLEQLKRLAAHAGAGGGAGGETEKLGPALCAALGALLTRVASSETALPLVLSHARWMTSAIESFLRSAASAAGQAGHGAWADVASACVALSHALRRAPPPATDVTDAAAATVLLAAAGGTAAVGEVDRAALAESLGAAADRCQRLHRALLVLVLSVASETQQNQDQTSADDDPALGVAGRRWAQRPLLEALATLRYLVTDRLPAAAALAPLSRLVGATSPAVRLLSLSLVERSQPPEETADTSPTGSADGESEHADEALPLRFAFGDGAAATVALADLERRMDGGEAEARLLAWGCALALLPHMRPSTRSRIVDWFKHERIARFLTDCVLPALPLHRAAPAAAASSAAPSADPTASVSAGLLAGLDAHLAALEANPALASSEGGAGAAPDASALAAAVFAAVLRRLPSLARHWWSAELTSRSAHAAVAKYTELHVSPLLLKCEVKTNDRGYSLPTARRRTAPRANRAPQHRLLSRPCLLPRPTPCV